MVVLLTGGSRGIGAAAVRALHRDGAEILFTYANRSDAAGALVAELRGRARAIQCDASDYDALPSLVDECVSRYGRIDVLVNNAAIFEENPFFGNDYATWRRGWERTLAINLLGAVHLTYLTLQKMRAQGGGKVVNVASRSAHRGELSVADYGASKAALVNFTKSIARSCGPYGIKAVAIAPGFIETEMAQPDLSTRRAQLEAEVPLGYIGSAQEVGEVIAFFASPKGDYANGATIDLNGGSYVR